MDEIGGGFRKGARNAGIVAGAGPGLKILGSRNAHELALAYGHLGWIVTDVLGKDQWYNGNLEFWGELFGGAQTGPKKRYVFGLAIGPRYHFVTHSHWVPFIDVGGGGSYTDIEEPDLSTKFQFNLQVGFGTHYFLREDLSMTMQVRGLHLSNAGIKHPNTGANTILFLAGLSWFFK
jgi:hypothetical protein